MLYLKGIFFRTVPLPTYDEYTKSMTILNYIISETERKKHGNGGLQ